MASSVWIGIAAGGLWNLASLWCLRGLLHAWLGPQRSRRHVLLWLSVKFPLLYTAAFLLLRRVSVIGFGLGFTLVLVAAIGWFALRPAVGGASVRQITSPAHGR